MKIIKKIIKKVNPAAEKPASTYDKRAEALKNARLNRALRKEAGEVEKKRNPREVWQDDKTSMRKAINCNCFECCGEENYRNRIKYCNIFTCPFWIMRPYGKGIDQQKCSEWVEDRGE